MEKDEVQKLINSNPHLKKYVEDITAKIGEPTFYSNVPRDLKSEKYPNIIYPTKGIVFIHIYRTKDMDGKEYHSIEPVLDDVEKQKRDYILDYIYEKAPYRDKVQTDDEIKIAIKKFIEEITILDEKAYGKIEKSKGGKIKISSVERMDIEYDITRDVVGGGPLECFMRDPYLEDIHIITGENIL